MVASVMCLSSACDGDEPTPEPTPDKPNNGEVSFQVEIPNGSGSGTASSPVVVPTGEALNMAISQTSSYTDPSGKVFTCEPQATISLSAQLDTVVAKDLTNLTSVKDVPDVQSSTSGSAPVVHKTLQKLNVGGQEIDIDLRHEIYTITNSANQKIEMPYIKLNQAKLGSANATEETPQGRAAVAVSAVTVRPLAMSRAQTVTDSTMYEVNVRLNLTLESVNSKANNSQTLEFLVSYVGVVETTTTLEDPKAELSYVWDVKSGTNSTASPFVQTDRNPMEIWMAQTSVYTDELNNKFSCEPKAKITISVPQDTVWADSLEDLKKLVETSDAVGKENTSATQIFTVGGKQISLDWSYELGQTLEDKNVVMPYYKLSPVTLKDTTEKELEVANTATSEKNIAAYEITATFVQKVTAAGYAGDFTQSFDIEYVVKYIGAMEVTIADVVYTKGCEWLEAHDNLPLRSNVSITREIIYSNGKRTTEKYQSPNYMTDLLRNCDNESGEVNGQTNLSDDEVINFTWCSDFTNDYNFCSYYKTGVPDLSKLSYRKFEDYDHEPGGPEYWDKYHYMEGEGTWGTVKAQGWYTKIVGHQYKWVVDYADCLNLTTGIRLHQIETGFYDSFYYFADTDTVVDFWDWRMTVEDTFTEESAQIAEGPARVFKHECKARYLDRNFYAATVDTVYQNK